MACGGIFLSTKLTGFSLSLLKHEESFPFSIQRASIIRDEHLQGKLPAVRRMEKVAKFRSASEEESGLQSEAELEELPLSVQSVVSVNSIHH